MTMRAHSVLNLAVPGVIGATTPAAGTFTDLTATTGTITTLTGTSGTFTNLTATSNVYVGQAAPAVVDATASLTIANLLSLIITTTSATGVSLTLPTGTSTDAGILAGALGNDRGFEWSIINLGSAVGTITMVAETGHTFVGSATIAIGTSALFRTRKTATNTFVTYRIV